VPNFGTVERDQVLDLYASEGVLLLEEVRDATLGAMEPMRSENFQSGLLNGIRVGCDVLRKDPSAQLAGGVVKLPEDLLGNVAANAFVTIVNTSVEPVTVEGGANFKARWAQPVPTQYAGVDGEFSAAFQRFVRGRAGTEIDVDDGSRVIHDDGRPLFLLKNHGDFTAAVSLASFTNRAGATGGGVEFPAGMLCNVGIEWEHLVMDYRRPGEVVLVPVEYVDSVTPARLTANAFPSQQRGLHTDPTPHDFNVQYLGTRPTIPASPLHIERIAQSVASYVASNRSE